MKFDPFLYNYPSKRTLVYSAKGAVATGHPLAAQAGLEILKMGGNAIDAAVATAACLTVVEPCSNGIGGDAFAIFWTKNKLHGLNSSGPAPINADPAALKKRGFDKVPAFGWDAVTVPGIPKAWAELVKNYGKLPLSTVLQPAINYAAEGHPLSVYVARGYQSAFSRYKKEEGECFKSWFDTFAPGGRVPETGEIWTHEGMAKTLESIGKTNADSFYKGTLAEKIIDFSNKTGGCLVKEDLERYAPEWVDTISVNYKGYDVHEIPPNGHGITALIALNILKGLELPENRESFECYHKQIEAIKLAFADAQKYVTDPKYMKVSVAELLSEAYASERRKLITQTALTPFAGNPDSSGTVYLAAADGEGNMISYIQSNYMGFGSGLVVPGAGISLQNRGNNFSLDENHDNYMQPGKRPYHTIIPGFLTKDGKPVGPFGVMGGFMQPQGHLQVVSNTIDYGMNPQTALDAPRWQWTGGKTIELEASVPQHIAQKLADSGHDIKVNYSSVGFGRGQIILKQDNGVLCSGTEPRTDGSIASW